MNARNLLVALLFWVFFILPIPVLAAPASGYWGNPNAPGSGFVIEVQGNEMFLASFLCVVSKERFTVCLIAREARIPCLFFGLSRKFAYATEGFIGLGSCLGSKLRSLETAFGVSFAPRCE